MNNRNAFAGFLCCFKTPACARSDCYRMTTELMEGINGNFRPAGQVFQDPIRVIIF